MRWWTLLWLGSGCATAVHQVAASGGSAGVRETADDRRVYGEADQKVILGFVQDTAYVDLAYQAMVDQCRDGVVVDVAATYQTQLGFFSWRNVVLFEGRCAMSR